MTALHLHLVTVFPQFWKFLWRSFQQCEEKTRSYGHLTNNIFTERCNIHSPPSSSGLDPLHACLQRFNKVGANIPHRARSILSSCCHAVAVSSTPMRITSHYTTASLIPWYKSGPAFMFFIPNSDSTIQMSQHKSNLSRPRRFSDLLWSNVVEPVWITASVSSS